jgi:salicylate biosynthesis isochorismate synthase/menaquinone-specific isochorismate synthase
VLEIAAGSPAAEWLPPDLQERLSARIDSALRRARRVGAPVLASLTAITARGLDPTAVVAASRRSAEDWFCLEQPERERSALAALGCVHRIEAQGQERFSQLSERWQKMTAAAIADAGGGPAGSGLVAVGGFAFAHDGCRADRWEGFAPASLVVPELSFARRAEEASLTVNVEVMPDDTEGELLAGVGRRLRELRADLLPLLDPAPTGVYEVRSQMPPAHYEEAVRGALARIHAGELEKVVLAREVEVRGPAAHDPGAVLGVLREAFPSCYTFAVGRGDAAFVAASPELLVRREGQRASTVALAGSARRSADPAVDQHLGEQLRRSEKDRHENAIVVRRIASALQSRSLWVTVAPEPALVRVLGIQHLATPIRAQLASPISAIELCEVLHPTPAVGGEPREVATALIPALEGLDRGWYAGPVGWTDAVGDGEFCVALRCALLRGRRAHLYAGCGIVADSAPSAELAESELKLDALLPVLTG